MIFDKVQVEDFSKLRTIYKQANLFLNEHTLWAGLCIYKWYNKINNNQDNSCEFHQMKC